MVSITFDKTEGIALLRWMNYLFASIQDFESLRDTLDKVENEKEKEDAQVSLDMAELAFRRAIDEVQKITPDETVSIVNKLEAFRLELVKEGEEEASNIDAVEVEAA